MDPFRDELAAAHSKIAKLEGDLEALKRPAPDATKFPASKSPDSRFVWFFVGVAFCVALACGFFFGGNGAATHSRERDEQFRALATHPPPAPDLFPAPANTSRAP